MEVAESPHLLFHPETDRHELALIMIMGTWLEEQHVTRMGYPAS